MLNSFMPRQSPNSQPNGAPSPSLASWHLIRPTLWLPNCGPSSGLSRASLTKKLLLLPLLLSNLLFTGCESPSDNPSLTSEIRTEASTAGAGSKPANSAAATTTAAPSDSNPAATSTTAAATSTVTTTTTADSAKAVNNKALLNQVFKDFRGQEYTINNLQGKVVLIIYWATWCGPCKREVPALNELYDRYRQKEVVFLAVSQDEERATVEDFLRTDKVGQTIKYPIIYGAPYTKIFGRMNAIPTLLLLDKQGNTVGKHEGTAPAEVIAQAIEKYL
jgi:cytochrome c biogenesis protein CcmG, thiol:disulfide interchange protein DsbE